MTSASDLLQLGDGAIVWEADSSAVHFSFVSDSAEKVLGFAPVIWKSDPCFLRAHVHPDDWSRVLDAIYRAAAEHRVMRCQHRMLRADGSVLWAQTTVRSRKTPDGVELLSGVTLDLTQVRDT